MRNMRKVFIEVLERYEESGRIKEAVVREKQHTKLFKVGEIVDDFQICLHKGIVQFYEEIPQEW